LEQFIDKKQVDLFFSFVNNVNIRHGYNNKTKTENKEPKEIELKIFFDFGLSLVHVMNS